MAQEEAQQAQESANSAAQSAADAQVDAWNAKDEVDSLRQEMQTGFTAIGEAIAALKPKAPADGEPKTPEKKPAPAPGPTGEESGTKKRGMRWRGDW